MAERLLVYVQGQVVGTLEQDPLTFAYTAPVVEEQAGAILISAALKVRQGPFSERELRPFFEGLLPEGLARQRLATRFRLDYADVFGLLREIGRDCAGAISIMPEDLAPSERAAGGVVWLDDEQLAEAVDQLDNLPLGVRPDRGVRLSLAGVQDKLVVMVDSRTGAIGLPRGTTPSTHIPKPAPKERYPGLVLNEALCMVLAAEAGLETAGVRLIEVGAEPALLVERFDRRRLGEGVERIHQEDFCQALRVPFDRKYQFEGGPDLRRMVDFLNRTSTDAAADIERLLLWEAFNFLIGNSDGHAKNVSILYSDRHRLAPAYDLVCTEMFGLAQELGQAIGDEYLPRLIRASHWLRELDHLGLNRRRLGGALADFGVRVEAAMPRAEAWLRGQGHWNDSLELVGQLVRERHPVLAELG